MPARRGRKSAVSMSDTKPKFQISPLASKPLIAVAAPHVNVYAAEEAIAIDVDFWCVHWQVIRMDGAVLYLQVMPSKKAYAADVDAEAFGDIDINAAKDDHRVDGGGATVQGDAREIDVHAAEKA